MEQRYDVYRGATPYRSLSAVTAAEAIAVADLADEDDLRWSIEEDGWCGSIDTDRNLVVILEAGDELPAEAAAFLRGEG